MNKTLDQQRIDTEKLKEQAKREEYIYTQGLMSRSRFFMNQIDSLIQEIKQETISVNQSTYAIRVLEKLKERI